MPDGGTLLHNYATSMRAAVQDEVAFYKFLLDLGLDINALDNNGQTLLHRMAPGELTQAADIQLALTSGADATIKDKTDKRAYDLVPLSHEEVRVLFK